jgi:dephospho-CoA kinase
MLLVALTGGLGSGKSTIGTMLAELGAVVIEADDLARRAVERGSAGLRKLVDEFGRDILDAGGDLDRARMAAIAFTDPEDRRRLEAVTHPEVARLLSEALEPLRETDRVVVYAVPLLVERGLQDAFDVVVTVSAPVEERVRRVSERIPEDDARARIAAQVSDEAREAIADVVLRNDGTPEDLTSAVADLWRDLRSRGG